MNALHGKFCVFKFLRKTALWIVLAPWALVALGAASNQLVLAANHDRFPVMWSDYKVEQYARFLAKTALTSKDADTAEQADFDLGALATEGFIDDTHVVMSSKTHLNFLADWIDLKESIDSPGDLSLDLGYWMSGYSLIVWGIVVVQRLKQQET